MYLRNVCTATLAAALAACGGGGGDAGTPILGNAAPLTSTNYTVAAREAMSAALQLEGTSSYVVGAEARRLASSALPLASRARSLAQRAASSTPRSGARPSAVHNDTVPCDNAGGTLAVSFNDANNNLEIDTGDSIAATATNCTFEGETANGRLVMTVTAAQGRLTEVVYLFTMTIVMTDFRTAGPAGTFTGNGSLAVTLQGTAVNTGSTTLHGTSFTSVVNDGTATSTRTLNDFTVRSDFRPSGSSTSSLLTISGSVASSALEGRSVTITTLTPFAVAAGARYPGSGALRIVGANGSVVRVTAQSASTVLIELDADGNGAFETSTTRPWSELD